jgi:hypothetical protein
MVTGRKRKEKKISQVWWYRSIIPVLRRLRQEDSKFKACLDYIARFCRKKKKRRKEGRKEGRRKEKSKKKRREEKEEKKPSKYAEDVGELEALCTVERDVK